MFRIGEFSRFSRVSVKMLRHYDELGLLKPARVDPFSGYRYYSADQLPQLNRIVALKDLGFRLEQIAKLMHEDLSLDQLHGMLKLRRAELEQQMQLTAAQLAQVEARLGMLERAGKPPRYEVVLRGVPAQQVAGIRQPGSASDAAVAALFEQLETYVARFQARAPLPPLLIYHDAEFPEQGEDLEMLVPVDKPLPANERIAVRELAGHNLVACLIHTGGYEDLPEALGVLLGWIERNRFRIAGATREVYLRFGADQRGYVLPEAYVTSAASEFVTELQIPVALEPAP